MLHVSSCDSCMYQLLLSRAITGLSFNFIPYVDIPYISASFHSRLLGGAHNSNVRRVKAWFKWSKVMNRRLLNAIWRSFFRGNFHLKINWCSGFLFLFYFIFFRVSKVFFIFFSLNINQQKLLNDQRHAINSTFSLFVLGVNSPWGNLI